MPAIFNLLFSCHYLGLRGSSWRFLAIYIYISGQDFIRTRSAVVLSFGLFGLLLHGGHIAAVVLPCRKSYLQG